MKRFEYSGRGQISVDRVNKTDISKYGVINLSESGEVQGLVVKPDPSVAPANLGSIGRYVLNYDIFQILRELPLGIAGEIQLADAINIQAGLGMIEATTIKGNRFDCGSVEGFIEAIIHVYKKGVDGGK